MKKAIGIMLALAMLLSLAACGTTTPTATATPVVTATPKATQEAAKDWTVKIGDYSLTKATAAGLTSVTKTLKKVSSDGSLKDQQCTGYTIASILTLAGVKTYTTITVVAADGFTYDLTKDFAKLDTTLLVMEQNGEKYTIPRLAVDGQGSKAWVKDVVELKIVK